MIQKMRAALQNKSNRKCSSNLITVLRQIPWWRNRCTNINWNKIWEYNLLTLEKEGVSADVNLEKFIFEVPFQKHQFLVDNQNMFRELCTPYIWKLTLRRSYLQLEQITVSVFSVSNSISIDAKHGFRLGQAGRVIYLTYSGLSTPFTEV